MPKPAIAVFCASTPGTHPDYLAAARALGTELGTRGLTLVYGGASVGLMGALADAALAAGAPVIGVLPSVLKGREIAHPGLTELHYVDTMHERKALMADRADAFLALPGGYGTLDEFLEILTWAQLGIHTKPCALLNTRNFYNPLLSFLDHATTEGFLHPRNRALIHLATTPTEALDTLLGRLQPNATQANLESR